MSGSLLVHPQPEDAQSVPRWPGTYISLDGSSAKTEFLRLSLIDNDTQVINMTDCKLDKLGSIPDNVYSSQQWQKDVRPTRPPFQRTRVILSSG
jgi:hypothetical protein